MNNQVAPLILCVDDDVDTLKMMERFLKARGYHTLAARDGIEALKAIQYVHPDLIILDVMMPELDGYEVCSRLQQNPETAYIPILFATALGEEKDKARAFAAGAVDYLVKPIEKESLLLKVNFHLKTKARWTALRSEEPPWDRRVNLPDFRRFKAFLAGQFAATPGAKAALDQLHASQLYSFCREIQITGKEMALLVADYLGLPYLTFIDPQDVRMGIIPAAFSKANLVVPIGTDDPSRHAFVMSNPFDLHLLETLTKYSGADHKEISVSVSDPESIAFLLGAQPKPSVQKVAPVEKPKEVARPAKGDEMARKILIIDDDQDLGRLISTKLKSRNYEVVIAYDGMQGVSQAHRFAPDLILLDIKLPGGGGYRVFENLKKSTITSGIPLIFISALPAEEVESKAKELGADDFILKPFAPEEVITRIEKLLAN